MRCCCCVFFLVCCSVCCSVGASVFIVLFHFFGLVLRQYSLVHSFYALLFVRSVAQFVVSLSLIYRKLWEVSLHCEYAEIFVCHCRRLLFSLSPKLCCRRRSKNGAKLHIYTQIHIQKETHFDYHRFYRIRHCLSVRWKISIMFPPVANEWILAAILWLYDTTTKHILWI